MDSPIIILIFWIVVNIIIKNSKDKKKAEQRRQRAQNTPPPKQQSDYSKRVEKQSPKKDFRKTIDEYRQQLEKELLGEQAKKKPVTQSQIKQAPKPDIKDKKTIWGDEIFKPTEDEPIKVEVIGQENRNGKKVSLINIKNDVVKGIIYSEVLDKPKSLRH